MFESLSEKIDSALHRLSGRSKISDINIAEAVKDIRRALVDADVNYKLAKDFTDRVKDRAMGQDVLKSLEPGQLMVKIVRDEIAELRFQLEAEKKRSASLPSPGASPEEESVKQLKKSLNEAKEELEAAHRAIRAKEVIASECLPECLAECIPN
jgi:signal recognition particle GTPase